MDGRTERRTDQHTRFSAETLNPKPGHTQEDTHYTEWYPDTEWYPLHWVCAPCIMHMWNKNPTLSQNHNLPTYLLTHLRIKFPTYLCASFPTSQTLVPTFSFPAFSLPTLHTFSLFLSKTTPYLPTCLPPSLSGSFSYPPSLTPWEGKK